MESIKDLQSQKDVSWVSIPEYPELSAEDLLWYCAQELSILMEIWYTPEKMRRSNKEVVHLLQDLKKFFQNRGEPCPRELLHVMIMVRRADAGLDPRA